MLPMSRHPIQFHTAQVVWRTMLCMLWSRRYTYQLCTIALELEAQVSGQPLCVLWKKNVRGLEDTPART